MGNDGIYTGKCSKCGKIIPVEFLSGLPDTDAYFLNRLKGIIPNPIKEEDVHPEVLLCPSCMAKYEQEHHK